MQSEMHQQTSGGKSPYLSQYRNDVSAKQKQIRQRLGYDVTTPPANSSLSESTTQPKQPLIEIPSIDDEIVVEQVSQDRRFKSRLTHDDEEAEASLQFFKRNLLPSSGELKKQQPSAGKYEQCPSLSSSNAQVVEQSPTPRSSIPPKAPERRRPSPDKYVEPKHLANNNNKFNYRPSPTKQTSLDDPIDTPQPRHSSPTSQYQRRTAPSPSPRLPRIEKPLNDQVRHLRSSSSERRSQRRAKDLDVPLEELEIEKYPDTKTVGDSRSMDGRQSADPPTPTGSFSRKPLYNSLLRAHDSIRLKVNRPKVRPKSDVVVKDTEIDAIPLAEINPSPSLNERAVDVKRRSSRKKNKKKEQDHENGSGEKLPVRNFSEVRVVKVVRSETERSLGVTVRAEDGNIVVARIMAGSLADKQGALQVGDVILSVNNIEVYTPEQLQEQLRKTINEDTVLMKIVPSFREELPTLCIYLRALFTYDANEDSLLPCKEVGVSFNQGDILEVVNQEDPNWWQARRVESENLQTGLIPSQELEERRRAFVIPDYDLATRTSICGTKVSRKSKKKEIYNVGQNSDFDKAELQLYEEVCRTPAFERRTLVLIGANGVGKQAIKARLIQLDPERFGTPLPHTSRLPREGEEDGIHYHFVTREKMEEDIIEGKYLEYGEYDGALYGTKLDSVREIIGAGKVCVLDCSATCLKILKTSDYLPFVAFIAAPTLDQLRYMHEWARSGNRNYTTFDRALSRQSRRAKTLQDFAFDFFEDEDLQLTVEESARLFRVYENYFDIVLVNNNFERTFEQLKDAIDALSMAPQWIPISWIYGT